jgi:glycosyltransferase involved in cell wall biosynthesis
MRNDAEMKLGVVIPTLNCAQLMEAHVDSMIPWLDRVEEIIVVDSNSTDGTLEILTNRIAHPNLRVNQRPKGLYQAWNYGIGQIQSKYTYISTVGDSITPDGLDHLVEVAEKYQCDVVVSKPDFVKMDGSLANQIHWPIDDVIEALQITDPIILSDLQLLVFQMKNIPATILGSSASNLYRTDLMKRCPFPTDYGTSCDAAWGFQYGLENRIGITPRKFTKFLQHEKSYSRKYYAVNRLNEKLIDTIEGSFVRKMESVENYWNSHQKKQIKELFTLIRAAFLHQAVLEKSRQGAIPWVLNPKAWQARGKRKYLKKQIKELSQQLIDEGMQNQES